MFIPDPGSDFFSIPDPNCLHPVSRIQGSKRSSIPDPGSGFATLNFSLLILKIIPLAYLVLKDPTAAISTSVADLDPGYGAFFNP